MITKNAETYNQGRYPAHFVMGDLVLIYRVPPERQSLDATRRTRALASYASGPWRVVRVLSNNNFLLQHIRTGATDTFNADTIVPLRTDTEYEPDDSIHESADDANSDSDTNSDDLGDDLNDDDEYVEN